MKNKAPDDPGILKKLNCIPVIKFPGYLLMLFMIFGHTFIFAQIQLVKDINQVQDWYYSEYAELTDVNGTLYFIVKSRELWKSDGTPEGTVPVKKLSGVSQLTNWAGTLFFVGNDGVTGSELWKSDGTEAGTVRVKDIYAGSESSSPHDLTVSGGLLFFIANNGLAGYEVWKSDGTAAGTRLVKDIKAGAASGNASGLTDVNGTLFFSATTGTAGYELWISDGTNSGTKIVRDIYPGSSSSFPRKLANGNGILFFEATEGVAGRELWKSDGTKGGTVRVKDIRPGPEDSFLNGLTAVNGVVFFVAHDGIHGKELWKSDGTNAGTVLVKDISPGPSSHSGFAFNHIDALTNVEGTLFFVAYNNNNHDLWRSDGTEAGTFPLTTGSDVTFQFQDPQITSHQGQVYFFAQQSYSELQFWKSDGTPGGTAPVVENFSYFEYGSLALLGASGNNVFAVGGAWSDQYGIEPEGYKLYIVNATATGVILLKDIVPATVSSSPGNLTDVNGTLFFSAGPDNEFQPDLWKSDGTEAGTVQVKDLLTLHDLTEVNGKLFFGGYEDYTEGDELWASDGTTAGTQVVKIISNDHSGSDPRHLTNVNDVLFFSATGPTGRGLWISDGTESGTVRVASMTIPWGWGTSPDNYRAFDNRFYFEGDNGVSAAGFELWKSDGTPGGTTLVKDINPGAGKSGLHSLTATGNTLFFVADDGTHGFELWKSDGSEAGTIMVADLEPGISSSGPQELTAFQGALIFTAVTSGSRALWISDGTSAGTTMLQDFYPGEEAIHVLESIGDEIFMLVRPSQYSTTIELWKSNGTATGTVKLHDMITLNTFNTYQAHAVLDDVLYFYSPISPQIWRTDGTACGTYALGYGQAGQFKVVNSTLLFSGNVVNAFGTELYKYDPEPSPCVAASARSGQTADQQYAETETAEGEGVMISHYPNPFSSAFSLSVAGKENGVYQVQVVTVNGVSVESSRELKFNADYTFGSQWGSGMYILKAVVDGKLVTRKLVKTR